jgi:hypothetical protein
MKTNHVPRAVRIKNRINKLCYRREGIFIRGKGRYYMFCRCCDRTNIQVSMEGHPHPCRYRGLDKEIAYYRRLLSEEVCKT